MNSKPVAGILFLLALLVIALAATSMVSAYSQVSLNKSYTIAADVAISVPGNWESPGLTNYTYNLAGPGGQVGSGTGTEFINYTIDFGNLNLYSIDTISVNSTAGSNWPGALALYYSNDSVTWTAAFTAWDFGASNGYKNQTFTNATARYWRFQMNKGARACANGCWLNQFALWGTAYTIPTNSLTINVSNLVNNSNVGYFCANVSNTSYSSVSCTTTGLLTLNANRTTPSNTSLTLPLTNATAFNGSATDTSPNAILATLNGKTLNHGTLVNNPTLNSSGKYSGAYNFDGIGSQRITTLYTLNISNPYTLCLWDARYSTSSTGLMLISGVSANGTGSNTIRFSIDSLNRSSVAFWNSTGSVISTQTSSTGAVSSSTYAYHCLSYNGTNTSLWTNGNQDIRPGYTSYPDLRYNLSIAGSQGTTLTWNGSLDEVRIWNASLSAAEIALEMNSAYPVRGQNLVASYSFELNNITAGATLNTTADTNYLTNGSATGEGAYYYDGSNDALSAGSSQSVNVSSMSICAWFNPSISQTTDIASRRIDASNRWEFTVDTSQRIRLSAGNGSTSVDAVTSSGVVNIGVWNFGCGIYNGTHAYSYINSTQSGTPLSLLNNITTGGATISVGSRSGSSLFFNGSISNVMVFSRALSSSEVLDLYERESFGFGTYSVTAFNVSDLGASRQDYFNVTNTSVFFNQSLTVSLPTYQALLSLSAYQLFTNASITGFNASNNRTSNITTGTTLLLPANNGTNTVTVNVSGNFSQSAVVTVSQPLSTVFYNFTGFYDLNLTLAANNGSAPLYPASVTISNGSLGGTLYNTTLTQAAVFQLLQGYQYVIRGNRSSYIANASVVAGNNLTQLFNITLLPLNIFITFKNENNQTIINGTNITLAVIDSLGNQDVYTTTSGSLTLSGTVPPGDYTFRYGATGYSLRDFYYTVPEETLNLTMYLLIDDLYSPGVVEVRDYDGSIVEGAIVRMIRYYGEPTIPNDVQMGTTDETGETVFVAEVLTSFYTWEVEVDGVTRYNTTIPELLALESDGLWHKIITLSPTATQETNKNTGFTYEFGPGGVINNNTQYTFTFTVNTTFWTLSSCTFQIINTSNSVVLGSNTTACTGNATLRITVTTPGSGNLKGLASVTTTDGFTNYYQILYNIRPTTSGFTMKDWLDDISDFDGAGFGDSTRFFIAVIVIIVITFGVSMRTDLMSSPEEALVLITVLIGFFSYLNWMNMNIPGVPFDWVNQYFVSIIAFLFTLGAFLRKRGIIFA